MAAAVAGHVADFVVGLADSKSDTIARDLFERKITLLQVVENLEEFLTSTNVSSRKRGAQLLADLMQKLPLDYLTEKEVTNMATFLLSRLSDHHSIQPFALKGMAAMVKFHSFLGGEMSRQICREIFSQIQNQTLSQKDRYATYSVFLHLLTYHLADIEPLGDTFVCGYVQQMDGEKDPRNLIAAFRCSLIICQHLSLGTMVEDMFEVNACYFPVDFIPPPNDPHGITRDDLRFALQQVLSSTPLFAEYCYPLLLEKISSDVQSAKVDALRTLCACLPVYQLNHLQEFVGSLFSQAIKEVHSRLSEEIVSLSLQVVTAITRELSKDPVLLEASVAEIKEDLIRKGHSDNSAMQLVSLQIFVAMARASPQVCFDIALLAVPITCSIWHKLTKWDHHIPYLSEVVALLEVISGYQTDHFDKSILAESKEQMLGLCDKLSVNQNIELQVLGMRGFCALSFWSVILSSQEMVLAGEKLALAAVQTDSDTLRKESHMMISKIFRHQNHACEQIIIHLKRVLLENAGLYNQADGKRVFDNAASLVVATVVDEAQAKWASSILLDIFQERVPEESLAPASAALSSVLAIGHIPTQYLTTEVVPKVLTCLGSSFKQWPDEKKLTQEKIITNLSDGLRVAILRQDESVKQQLCAAVCSLVMSCITSAPTEQGDSSLDGDIAKLPWQQSRLVQVLLAAIPCLCYQNESSIQQLLSWLPGMALYSSDLYTRLQACKCLAAIVNLIPAGPTLDSVMAGLKNCLTSCLGKCLAIGLRGAALSLLTWLTKAMVVRGHSLAADLTAQMLSLLQDECLALETAQDFGIILAPFVDVLCPAVHATVIPTYQQRFLVHTLPQLIAGFQGAPGGEKEKYLLAVAGMLTNIPLQVMTTELPQVMPLLVSSLQGVNSELHKQALTAVSLGIQHLPELVTAYLSDILNDCLRLSVSGGNMKLRILALKCLQQMTNLSHTTLQHHRSLVLKMVKPALDDHKRLVRKEAVAVLNSWCLL